MPLKGLPVTFLLFSVVSVLVPVVGDVGCAGGEILSLQSYEAEAEHARACLHVQHMKSARCTYRSSFVLCLRDSVKSI